MMLLLDTVGLGDVCSRRLLLRVPYRPHGMRVPTHLARVDAGCYTLWEFLQNETLLKHVIYRYLDRVLHRIQVSVDTP